MTPTSAFRIGDLVTPIVAGCLEDHRGEICVVVGFDWGHPMICPGGPYFDEQLRLVARPVACPFCNGTGRFPAVPEGTKP